MNCSKLPRVLLSTLLALPFLHSPSTAQEIVTASGTQEGSLIETPEVFDDPNAEQVAETRPQQSGLRDKYNEAKEKARTDPSYEAPDTILDGESPDPTVPPNPGDSPFIGAAAQVVRSFAGLDYISSGLRTPPDVTIAAGPNRLLEGVNATLRLFDTNGGVVANKSTSAFFGLTSRTTDPKVYYDRVGPNPRFVVVAMSLAFPPKLLLAVSRSSQPSNFAVPSSWCRYSLETPAGFPNLGGRLPEHRVGGWPPARHDQSVRSGQLREPAPRLHEERALQQLGSVSDDCGRDGPFAPLRNRPGAR